MEDPTKISEPAFTELAEFNKVGVQQRPTRGNIIKARSVVQRGIEKVGIADSEPDQPTVIIHKTGGVVHSAEIVCKCGRSATLQFDYEGE